jgi:chemotaxis family two-component system response regulator Rcp1
MTDRAFEILLVEDNPAFVRLTQEAFKRSKIRSNKSVARDGIEAMEFLNRTGEKADAPRPDLIFLDLNLPRKDGREVLAEIKADPDLKRIPVVILTTSNEPRDMLDSYNLHANCCIVKPSDLEKYFEAILSTEQFWLSTVVLPPL